MADFQNATFEKLCRYLGWGDPNNHGLWFIGLEEGGTARSVRQTEDWFREQSDLVRDGDIIYGGDTYPSCSPNRFAKWESRVPYYAASIACAVSASGLDVYGYMQQCLWRPGQGVFNANLYPLQKSEWNSWPDECIELSGFKQQQWPEYKDLVRDTRHQWLYSYLSAKKPQAVVCFGMVGWPYFCEALRLAEREPSPYGIVSYPEERVLLVPFFDNRQMGGGKASRIADILLKEWNVSIP